MIFESFEAPGLVHRSYLIGCPGAGIAAIIEPQRDVDVYQTAAARLGLDITHVFETHVPADYASGARELAERVGARLLLSGHERGEVYEYQFEHEAVRDGDRFQLGGVVLEAVFTPGHTPEHLCYLVYDTPRSEDCPMALLTGDFLFVGSLGRPDLLGEDAKHKLANKLFDSVRERLAPLPDGLEVHPMHGAGSL